MKDNYLIDSGAAQRLYDEYARELPIIDFHNHISCADIATDRRFENITELWLAPDPYKHRLMRICGVDENYISGDASPYEKFVMFCRVFPKLVGNPVYDWSRMELSWVFGIEEIPSLETADRIYSKTAEMLASPEFSNNSILSSFGIEYQSSVASAFDDLSGFDGVRIAPSLRGDNLISPNAQTIARLEKISGVKISDDESFVSALAPVLDRFSAKGCCFADHALDAGFFGGSDEEKRRRRMLEMLGVAYAKRGWTLLLHMGAKRATSLRLARVAGPTGGYAAVGSDLDIGALVDTLNGMEVAGGLPDTVLFPLNMSDQAPLSVLQGSFSQCGVASKVQLGPAWWWCDHALGIRNTLSAISSFGVLAEFIGMTTDSRSILSFVRHDYFRRILCSFIAEQNERAQWGASNATLGEIVRKICYENAKSKINRGRI